MERVGREAGCSKSFGLHATSTPHIHPFDIRPLPVQKRRNRLPRKMSKGNVNGSGSSGSSSGSNNGHKEEWEKYVDNCHKFDVKVDPSVVIALKSSWSILQPTKGFNEGAMLPLQDVLSENTTIKKLNLASAGMHDARYRSKGNGNSNARVVTSILAKNKSIQEVDLSFTGLDDDGIGELCAFIKSNTNVTSLNLSNNFFGELGAERLRAALLTNSTIKQLDVSRNALGFQSINAILCSCATRGMTVQTNGNFVFEEILNSLSHGLAFLASVVGANLLVARAADETSYTDYHFWACVLYSFSLMFLFLSSCLFHSFFMLPQSTLPFQQPTVPCVVCHLTPPPPSFVSPLCSVTDPASSRPRGHLHAHCGLVHAVPAHRPARLQLGTYPVRRPVDCRVSGVDFCKYVFVVVVALVFYASPFFPTLTHTVLPFFRTLTTIYSVF